MLHLTIVKAIGLVDSDWFGTTDPYVIATLGKTNEKHQTSTKACTDPIWNQSFCFYSLPEGKVEDTLSFKIYDEEKFAKDDVLGSASFDLTDIIPNRAQSLELELKPSASGKLLVNVFYSSTDVMYDVMEKSVNIKNADFSQFKNLSLEGGGVKGLAYGGACQVLEDLGILQNIERISGTSAGAISAFLLGMGCTASMFYEIMKSTDFSYFPKSTTLADSLSMDTLSKDYGWYTAGGFTEVLENHLVSLLKGVPGFDKEEARKAITFGQHHELYLNREKIGKPFRDVYFIGSNLTVGTTEVFSFEKTPDMPIATAVRISMSIPLYFTAVKYNNCVWADGGLRLNFPISVFDDPKYVSDPHHAVHKGSSIINYETLGMKTDTLMEIFNEWSHTHNHKTIDSFTSYASALADYFTGQSTLANFDKSRSILIDVADISTTDFEITEEKKNFLVKQGREWATGFLKWWAAGKPEPTKKFVHKFDPANVITIDDNDNNNRAVSSSITLNEEADATGVYKITILTGNRANAGTDAEISIRLVGHKGASKACVLDNFWYNDFETGATDEFCVKLPDDVGDVEVIVLKNNGGGLSSAWFADKVTVEDSNGKQFEFSVCSWIMKGDERTFFDTSLRLPSQVPDWMKLYRFKDLQQRKEKYQYALYDDLSRDGPGLQRPTLVDYPRRMFKEDPDLPEDEKFSNTKSKDFGLLILKGLIGKGGLHVDMLLKSLGNGFQWKKFEHFDKLYSLSGNVTPPVSNRWQSDVEYARQILGGLNPCMISLLEDDKVFSEFKINESTVKGLMKDGATIASEIAHKKFFWVDYRFVEGWLPKINAQKGKFIYACCAVFYLNADDVLVPFMIGLDQKKALAYTPNDAKWDWAAAKLYFATVDTGIHQLYSHWVRTHGCSESYVVAMRRNLSPNHPVYRLLKPHFRYTLAINAKARSTLINAGGKIEQAFFSGEYSMRISSTLYMALWDFSDQALPSYFGKRGVLDPKVLPNFPYRDDGLLVWGAIEKHVSNWLDMYYESDEAVKDDDELKAWYSELRRTGHPNKYDTFPKLKGKASLVTILTTMMWIVSGHHAAVNFAQYDYSSYGPNRPCSMTGPINEQRKIMREEDVFKRLPGPNTCSLVISVTKTLSTFASQGEEEYLGADSEFLDKKGSDCLMKFRKDLADVERQIEEANNSRSVPYKFLLPSQVTNSIAV